MSVKLASDKYLELKKETSRLASMANKRLVRLERNNLKMLPAYREWESHGAIKFSVKGKNYQQLQSEYWRLKHFLDDRTSTVRSANTFLKEMAENTGIKYKGLEDLKTKSTQFFELADKIKQYNQSINQSAQALDYQKIWQQINTYVNSTNTDLASSIDSNEQLQKFLNYMDSVQPVEDNKEGYSVGNDWDFIEI